MAILSKIRDRSIALIAVIGLALFAFVLDPSQLSDFFSSSKINKVGEIDGETISRQEFTENLDNYRARSRNRVSEMQAAKSVWDNLVREKIYTKQLEIAGITVGEEDVWKKIISTPSIANNPQFQNEAGLFDEEKFKLFLKETKESEDAQLWAAWQDYMEQLGNNLKRDTYNNLLNAGLGASLKEGEYRYIEESTRLSGDFVYAPYTSIPDSLVTITKGDISDYIEDHENQFQVEPSVSLSYVKFDIKATEEDKTNIKNELISLIDDKKVYNAVSKREEVIKGFKNTNDYQTFFNENASDIPLVEFYEMKSDVAEAIQDELEKSKVGDVIGPYEEGKYFKLLKITDIKRRPDSVKSSHIIMPFIGSQAANQNTTKTEAEAKKSIDSIFKLVRRNKKKFAEVADAINTDATKGKGGEIGWVSHRTAMSANFDDDFATFIFDGKKGDIDVVKTKFGFHIIRIDDQKNYQKAYKSVMLGRTIEASEKTENQMFQKAEQFALDISNSDDTYFNVAREQNYTTKPAVGLKILDERIPGISANARQVIIWAFQDETKLSDFKRFALDGMYIVAMVTEKNEEGLMSPNKALNRVRPILVNQKKAEMIKAKMKGSTLDEIAKNSDQPVKKLTDVSLTSPTIPGVGYEPNLIGAMFKSAKGELNTGVEGVRGVFAYVLTEKKDPSALPNYEAYRQRISEEQRNRTTKVFEALKKEADIEDNRPFYYGINN